MTKKIAPPGIVLARVSELAPSPENAKVHPAYQIAAIKASMREFGFTNPILADLDELGAVIAGHGRLKAAIELYEEGDRIKLPSGELLPDKTVPVIDLSGLTEVQRRAYMLADNKLAEAAVWDENLLKTELVFIEEAADFDLGAIGFSEADLARFLDGGDGSDADDQAASEWEGMPEFDQQDKKAFRSIPVHFKDQEAVDAFAKLIGQKITGKTRFVWFPEIEIERYADKRYSAADAEK